jgi:hypothetical protein
MLEWLHTLGFVLICFAAFLDADTRNLDKRLDAQERRKATPKRRHRQ